ncbi:MAG: hypothetical protein WAN35_14305 [Terracidiphilus sp.]
MPGVTRSKYFGRILFLLSCLFTAGLTGEAVLLLRAHPESHRGLLLVQFSLVLLGVFWIRSLERRLAEAGLPRWSFWPYFLIVFTACFGGHVLKKINGPETLGLFLLLQLPAFLFQSQHAPAQIGVGVAPVQRKPSRPGVPVGAAEFSIYLFLLFNLWNVLHLLHGDVSGFEHVKALRLTLDAGSWLLIVPWFFSVRGRMKALGRLRWTMHFCALTLIPCLMLFYCKALHFIEALILFTALQIPTVFLRREWISAKLIPEDQDS